MIVAWADTFNLDSHVMAIPIEMFNLRNSRHYLTPLIFGTFYYILLKMGHSRPLFLLFSPFQYNTVDSKSMFCKNLPMSGFEPRTSGI